MDVGARIAGKNGVVRWPRALDTGRRRCLALHLLRTRCAWVGRVVGFMPVPWFSCAADRDKRTVDVTVYETKRREIKEERLDRTKFVFRYPTASNCDARDKRRKTAKLRLHTMLHNPSAVSTRRRSRRRTNRDAAVPADRAPPNQKSSSHTRAYDEYSTRRCRPRQYTIREIF